MHNIVLLGLNHQTAPVDFRERMAFPKNETAPTLEALHKYSSIDEVVLISTCNRVEVLMTTPNRSDALGAVKTHIAGLKNVPVNQLEKALYIKDGDEAVRHIFRVASSLDSMVIGEPQILGQIKEAYRDAVLEKTSGAILNRLFHRSFFVAKRVRTETGIGDHAVSISYAAIELGRKIFGSLEGKKVLLVGAGEMAELAVEHLIRNRVGDIIVANRTFERGVELAEKFHGKAVRFEELEACSQFVDIIITSTGSPDFILNRSQVKGVMRSRRNRPIFFIDIAVPRDVDPEINRISNAYVYNIDDLKGVVDDNITDRTREAAKGERIVDEAVIRFRQWQESLDVVPTIVALRSKMEAIAATEREKTLQSLSNPSKHDRQAIQKMTDTLINKIMHDPTLYLKRNGHHGNKSACLDITRKLFKLND